MSTFNNEWKKTMDKDPDDQGGGSPLPEVKSLAYLLEQMPPVVARKSIPRMFGGAVSRGTLANADSRGDGPSGRFYVGRDVVYPTACLLEWMEKRGIRPQLNPYWRRDD